MDSDSLVPHLDPFKDCRMRLIVRAEVPIADEFLPQGRPEALHPTALHPGVVFDFTALHLRYIQRLTREARMLEHLSVHKMRASTHSRMRTTQFLKEVVAQGAASHQAAKVRDRSALHRHSYVQDWGLRIQE